MFIRMDAMADLMDDGRAEPSGTSHDPNWKDDSKRLCIFLRHRPDLIAIDEHGWASVSEIARHGMLSEDRIRELSAASRFDLSEDGEMIRAYHGHSFPVIYEPAVPPEILYHGTTEESYDAISRSGFILPMKRYMVHLSISPEYASAVGSRHGKHPIVLAVDSGRMSRDGIGFYLSGDGVYLCESVPAEYVHPLDGTVDRE